MDLNITTNYSFNPENMTYVMPYNQDMIIILLLVIASCQMILTYYILSRIVMK